MFEALKQARKQSAQKTELKRLLSDCARLLGEAGESISVSLARQALARFQKMDQDTRLAFYNTLALQYNPDLAAIEQAVAAYSASKDPRDLIRITQAAEPPRQELLRRLNRAPEGTAVIVQMREEILGRLKKSPQLAAVDADFEHLLSSWFNPGFLRLEKIDWNSPAHLLEKIIQHEAVHAIDGWADLRRRLEQDRRLFAYFHPALPNEPLIFVEVALVPEMPESVGPLLDRKATPDSERKNYKVATFYSISNCQPGLKGIHLGNFLIKRVAEYLKAEFPSLKTFCTLSPIPTLASFLSSRQPFERTPFSPKQSVELQALREEIRAQLGSGSEYSASTLGSVQKLCAAYLLQTSPDENVASDPVARFHLNNGARLERINLNADSSAKGSRQSLGLMVNYAYDLNDIETNHERFVAGEVIASRQVKNLLS
ncbi:malonyl-CoA decarboxylase family protein [beta proteobacterium MWH-UniP1]